MYLLVTSWIEAELKFPHLQASHPVSSWKSWPRSVDNILHKSVPRLIALWLKNTSLAYIVAVAVIFNFYSEDYCSHQLDNKGWGRGVSVGPSVPLCHCTIEVLRFIYTGCIAEYVDSFSSAAITMQRASPQFCGVNEPFTCSPAWQQSISASAYCMAYQWRN